MAGTGRCSRLSDKWSPRGLGCDLAARALGVIDPVSPAAGGSEISRNNRLITD